MQLGNSIVSAQNANAQHIALDQRIGARSLQFTLYVQLSWGGELQDTDHYLTSEVWRLVYNAWQLILVLQKASEGAAALAPAQGSPGSGALSPSLPGNASSASEMCGGPTELSLIINLKGLLGAETLPHAAPGTHPNLTGSTSVAQGLCSCRHPLD